VIGIAILGTIVASLWAITQFENACLLFVFLIPLDPAFPLGGGLNFRLQLTRLILLPALILRCLPRIRRWNVFGPESVVIVFFLVILVNTLLLASNLFWSLQGVAREAATITLFLSITEFCRTTKQVRRLLGAVSLGLVFPVVYGLYQYFILQDFGTLWYIVNPSTYNPVYDRMTSFLPYTNMFAAYLSTCLFICVGFAVNSERFRMRLLNVILIICSAICILLTFSRTASIATAVAAIVTLILLRRLTQALLPIAALVLVAYVAARYYPQIEDLLYQRQDTAQQMFEGRLDFSRLALAQFYLHPVTGIGYGNFLQNVSPLIQGAGPVAEPTMVHDDYVQYLCELGVIGFAAFCAAVLWAIIPAIVLRARLTLKRETWMIDAALTALTALLINALATPLFEGASYGGSILWLLLAILIALARIGKQIEKMRLPLDDISRSVHVHGST
jgi:O-antigen ligase